MYFPFFILRQRSKRSAIRPQTIYSEVPLFLRFQLELFYGVFKWPTDHAAAHEGTEAEPKQQEQPAKEEEKLGVEYEQQNGKQVQ